MEKAQSFNRLALIGYRCTGKSTVGRLLASLLSYRFVDMDEVLADRTGTSIDSLVRKHGWLFFRNMESELLRELSSLPRIVVATGGGIVELEENRRILKKKFFVVWLEASPEVIKKRLINDPASPHLRPSLTGKSCLTEVDELLERRHPLYQEVAHLRILTDSMNIQTIAGHIARHWQDI
ncbi:MAG: shikimate kinase [Deltaproteobacteria bacterium]|nr:shikimate kinase [Deltaproteobacteria bacterium]MBW2069517.1 shikimate kinase [Deltaproteobacteria bacterium]